MALAANGTQVGCPHKDYLVSSGTLRLALNG